MKYSETNLVELHAIHVLNGRVRCLAFLNGDYRALARLASAINCPIFTLLLPIAPMGDLLGIGHGLADFMQLSHNSLHSLSIPAEWRSDYCLRRYFEGLFEKWIEPIW